MTAEEANRRLAADLKNIMRDAEELLKATAGDAGETVKEVRGRLAQAVEAAKETFTGLQDKTVEVAKSADHLVRDHPYESLGVALGIGLLIGALIGRR
jgi:ElaB/YqjD/DUF883 family membrane-anchored ribosome-binding protein